MKPFSETTHDLLPLLPFYQVTPGVAQYPVADLVEYGNCSISHFFCDQVDLVKSSLSMSPHVS